MNKNKSYKLGNNFIEKTACILSICLLYCILNPFFLWETYHGGILSSIGFPLMKVLYIITPISLILVLGINKCIKKIYLYCSIIIIASGLILTFICGAGKSSIKITVLLNIIFIALLILLSYEFNAKVYQGFRNLFAILLIPGIFYTILAFIGISFPYDILSAESAVKVNNYVTYMHFPFAIQITKTYDMLGNVNRFRLCGMLDEPGRIGTMCAFFLVNERFRFKHNWKNLLILIGGILSFSVTFFLIVIFYCIYITLSQKNVKTFLFLALIVLIYIIFINLKFNNVLFQSLQYRLSFSQGKFLGDNRTNDIFLQFINDFIFHSNFIKLLFGNGSGSTYNAMTVINNGYSSSFLALIYDYGIIGFTLIIFWPFYFYFVIKNKCDKKHIFICLLVQIINLYQRPSVFLPSYIYVFIGGIFETIFLQKSEFSN